MSKVTSNFFSLEKPHNLIIAVLLIVVVVLGYMQFGRGLAQPSGLSPKAAVDMALGFINKNMIQAGAPAAVLNGDIKEEAGLYVFNITVQGKDFPIYISKDGNMLFPQAPINIKEAEAQKANATTTGAGGNNATTTGSTTIGSFKTTTEDVCLEDGKPIIYFFGSKGCPHCVWEKPVIEKIAQDFKGLISFHENIDNNKEMDIFSKYSQGGIPTLVLGCKYFREGSGEQAGEEQESKNLTALFCKLTNSQPTDLCSGVADLISQIK